MSLRMIDKLGRVLDDRMRFFRFLSFYVCEKPIRGAAEIYKGLRDSNCHSVVLLTLLACNYQPVVLRYCDNAVSRN